MRSGKNTTKKNKNIINVVGDVTENVAKDNKKHFKTAVRRLGFFLGGFLLGKLTSFLISLL